MHGPHFKLALQCKAYGTRLVLLWKCSDIVLERIGHPSALDPDIAVKPDVKRQKLVILRKPYLGCPNELFFQGR